MPAAGWHACCKCCLSNAIRFIHLRASGIAFRTHLKQEIAMNRKLILPAAIAASILGVTATVPVTLAQTADQAKPTMEHRSDKAQSTMENRGDKAKGAIKDAWLDGKLESAYLFNEHLSPFDIDTDVNNGVVHLTGSVDSDIDRDLAEEIAKSIEGVTDVKNDLVVDKAKARAARDRDDEASDERSGFRQAVGNATLTARIKTQLLANSNTSGMAVDVDSDNGTVTLSGTVDSDEEKELIARIAENTSGTDSVNNQLMVEYEAEEDAE
jgi:hyperosmotically inducible periplasmic protein